MIALREVTKRFGATAALDAVSLEVPEATTHVLLGSSGSGKSTVLRVILGLTIPDSGEVSVDGTAVDRSTRDRLVARMGYVVQDGGLYPHLTAADNVALAAEAHGWPRDRIAARLHTLTELTGLDAAMPPWVLDGGYEAAYKRLRDPQTRAKIAEAIRTGGSDWENLYLAAGSPDRVILVEFKNDKQFGLGVPLPAGRMRVSQLDAADGTLEFVGEDSIDHTPKDETVRVKLGSAFDVVGERRQTDFSVDTKARWLEEAFEIKLRNHKDQPVEVIVKENLFRWSNWTVLSKSHEFTKEDARTILFPVTVPKNSNRTVRYRVRYTW